MLNFTNMTIDDIDKIRFFLKSSNMNSCDYTFGNLFLWSDDRSVSYCIVDDVLFFMLEEEGERYYMHPICNNKDAKPFVDMLIKHTDEIGEGLLFRFLNKEMVDFLNNSYGEKFTFREGPKDYVYNSSDLINLSGKKYSSKRNHIKKIENENWVYENIDQNNIDECIKMYHKWYEHELNDNENLKMLKAEFNFIQKAFKFMKEIGLKGGLIRLDGEVIAFSIGEEINKENFDVYTEKAFRDIKGAYALINREFAANNCSNYKYINREDDLGIKGLQTAKMSYHPALLIQKYIGVYNG